MDIGILYVVFNKWIREPETNEVPYKIGITRGSVDDRYYGLGLKMPGKFETLFAYRFDDCLKAEQTIHSILNKKRENGEWFTINSKELDHIKTTCEIMGGVSVTDEIKNEIESETEAETGIEIKGNNGNEIVSTNGKTGKDILDMKEGDYVSGLFDLIVNSKNPASESWAGEEYKINGTPMKGINWVGSETKVLAVIIKTTGKYTEDSDGKQYAFEAKNGQVDQTIKSNKVIIDQKKYKYPILNFVKDGSKYILIGKYSVDKIFDTYVTLIPYCNDKK